MGFFQDGRCDVLANPSGDRVTPASVAWRKRDEDGGGRRTDPNETLTGLAARQLQARFPRAVVAAGNADLVGKSPGEVALSAASAGPSVLLDRGEEAAYEVTPAEGDGPMVVTASQVHTEVLKYMHGWFRVKY